MSQLMKSNLVIAEAIRVFAHIKGIQSWTKDTVINYQVSVNTCREVLLTKALGVAVSAVAQGAE